MRVSQFHTLALVGAVAFTCLTPNAEAGKDPAIKAAFELFEALELPTTYKRTVGQLVDMQVQQNPQIMPFREIMLNFFEKYMGWDSIKDDMARLYAEKFTVGELNQLKKFYLTPVGKKASRLLPELMAAGAAVGQQRVQGHMAELQQSMAAKAKELQAQQPRAQPKAQ